MTDTLECFSPEDSIQRLKVRTLIDNDSQSFADQNALERTKF